MKKSSRVRRYQFAIDLFTDMFREGTIITGVKVKEGWPKDAKILGLHADSDTYSFSVIVESKSFDKVKEGDVIPYGEIHFETLMGKIK